MLRILNLNNQEKSADDPDAAPQRERHRDNPTDIVDRKRREHPSDAHQNPLTTGCRRRDDEVAVVHVRGLYHEEMSSPAIVAGRPSV